MPYNSEHHWAKDDYLGASLQAISMLAEKKNYTLVSTNLSGINAFFVRNDLLEDNFPFELNPNNLYNPFRRNIKYLAGHRSRQYINNTHALKYNNIQILAKSLIESFEITISQFIQNHRR